MKPTTEEILKMERGGWVKLVRNQTVINGTIKQATATYITVDGLPPLPLAHWTPIIIKPAPKQVT